MKGQIVNQDVERILRDILQSYDFGVRTCVGVMQNGELCWKGSFIAQMERLRSLLPSAEE
jgi:hypothetical protein